MKKMSMIFQPFASGPETATSLRSKLTSKSQKLMMELGLLKSASSGTFHILPIGLRAIEKCTKLIDSKMTEVGAQKLCMPILTANHLWEKSGRHLLFEEFFNTRDRYGRSYILSPTNEESIAQLIGSGPQMSYKSLPLRLYQIGMKFRDEIKPRFGLIRAREFMMKDLYTFDADLAEAQKTYEAIGATYEELFKDLHIPWVKVKGDSGIMGGTLSHEYHVLADIGEETIIVCDSCSTSHQNLSTSTLRCPACNSDQISVHKGIEVGHTFLLGDKYSHIFGAKYLNSQGHTSNLFMGCYGIGITRLVAASLEALSDGSVLRWPDKLCPFNLCIIPPKAGSKEESVATQCLHNLYEEIKSVTDVSSVLLDDRTNLTIGKRLNDSIKCGYPNVLVAGAKMLHETPKFEVYSKRKDTAQEMSFSQLCSYLKELNKTLQV